MVEFREIMQPNYEQKFGGQWHKYIPCQVLLNYFCATAFPLLCAGQKKKNYIRNLHITHIHATHECILESTVTNDIIFPFISAIISPQKINTNFHYAKNQYFSTKIILFKKKKISNRIIRRAERTLSSIYFKKLLTGNQLLHIVNCVYVWCAKVYRWTPDTQSVLRKQRR